MSFSFCYIGNICLEAKYNIRVGPILQRKAHFTRVRHAVIVYIKGTSFEIVEAQLLNCVALFNFLTKFD